MPTVEPFAGLRFDPAAVPDLAPALSPPYDVIADPERAALEAASPYNVVRLELPTDPPDEPGGRYRRAAATLAAWRAAGVLQSDPRPAFYLCETRFQHAGQALRRRDLLGAVRLTPWSSGDVRPHELTLAAPKADRLALLAATHLNISPIWLLHRDRPAALDAAWAAAEAERPTATATWRESEYRCWRVDDPATVQAIAADLARGGPLYVADGHHRYETSLAFAAGQAGPPPPGAGAVLAAITSADDPGLLALPTHRLLRHLDPSLTLEALETRFSDVFHTDYYPVWEDGPPEQVDALMERMASAGRVAPTFGVLGLGERDLLGLLQVRNRTPPPERLPADRSAAWRSLDVALLHTLLVDPLVAESGHPRESVLAYTRDPHAAAAAVRAGDAQAAFFLNPTRVEQVLAVADAGDRMPEKSTYFSPKPPAGLVLRDLAAAT